MTFHRLLLLSVSHSSTNLHVLQTSSLKSLSSISNTTNKSSFTVSHLINSCGVLQKADSSITLLKNHGFSPDKTIKPMFDIVHGGGIFGPDLANFISATTSLLRKILKNNTTPPLETLERFFPTYKNIVAITERSLRVLELELLEELTNDAVILQENCAPCETIMQMVMTEPDDLTLIKWDFDLKSMLLVILLMTLLGTAAKTICHWLDEPASETKMLVFKGESWSENGMLDMCMTDSEKKIKRIMGVRDYLANDLGWIPSFISTIPWVFNHSLEEMIRPRWTAPQVLMEKGQINEDTSLVWMLKSADTEFFEFLENINGGVQTVG